MRLQLLGVRGSRPTPGPEHVRYGGNTSCIAITRDGAGSSRPSRPSLVLDGGTGLANLSSQFQDEPFDGSILLTHLHWDHVYGLPFFPAGDRPDARVDLWLPAQGDAETALENFMRPPHFPIRPGDLRGAWRFHALEPGTSVIESFEVLALDIPHKGGRTFGYRVSDGTNTVAYMPDHGPVDLGEGDDGLGAIHEAALRLAHGADVLFHDAQHTVAEFPAVRHFGHSTIDYAISLARLAQVRRLVLFHHDPARTDDLLDAIAAQTAGLDVVVEVAREGTEIILP